MEEIERSTDTRAMALDMNAIGLVVEAMDDALEVCKKAVEELDVPTSVLAEMEYDDVLRFERQASAAINGAEEARKRFKREWQAPMKHVEELFKAELESAKAMHLRYKGERTTRDAQTRAERNAILEGHYLEFMEANGAAILAENVQYGQIAEREWTNGGKKWSEQKAANAVVEKAARILGDWDALQKANLAYRDAAYVEFFNTLDVSAVIRSDKEREQDQKRAEAARMEAEANVGYQGASVNADEQRMTYHFTVELSAYELDMLRNFFRANNIHGKFRRDQ